MPTVEQVVRALAVPERRLERDEANVRQQRAEQPAGRVKRVEMRTPRRRRKPLQDASRGQQREVVALAVEREDRPGALADCHRLLADHEIHVVCSTGVTDGRGGYSYLIAALAAEGESIVRNVGIIRRGYEKLFTKLDALGADFDVIG